MAEEREVKKIAISPTLDTQVNEISRAVAEAQAAARDAHMTETQPGGVYETPDGRKVDANGEEVGKKK